jgi:hypothetical protein
MPALSRNGVSRLCAYITDSSASSPIQTTCSKPTFDRRRAAASGTSKRSSVTCSPLWYLTEAACVVHTAALILHLFDAQLADPLVSLCKHPTQHHLDEQHRSYHEDLA